MKAEIEWIPVSKRLPLRHMAVLITYEIGLGRLGVATASLDYSGNWFAHVGIYTFITAWAELPSPYIKEAGDE